MGVNFSSGRYYIGDPVHVFPDTWSDVLNETDFFKKHSCTVKGIGIFGADTFCGGGIYKDNNGNDILVDSGIIAVVPVSMLSIDGVSEVEATKYGIIREFSDGFQAIRGESGNFTIGNVTDGFTKVDTNGCVDLDVIV